MVIQPTTTMSEQVEPVNIQGQPLCRGTRSRRKNIDDGNEILAAGFSTRAIHIGSEPNESTGAVIPPISLSTTYQQTAIGVHKVLSSISIPFNMELTFFLIFLLGVIVRVLNIRDPETPIAMHSNVPSRLLRQVGRTRSLLHLGLLRRLQ